MSLIVVGRRRVLCRPQRPSICFGASRAGELNVRARSPTHPFSAWLLQTGGRNSRARSPWRPLSNTPCVWAVVQAFGELGAFL